jgi:D-alanyl-lipoteichoic acid acyltransferase DltB (MBOAT superfamily)
VCGVFAATGHVSWIDVVVGTFFFATEIYCDFSGYSDVAIGTANLFGIDLMRNFHFPYFARNPSEFWGRWHISLSSWFRDYVFFPLGGPYGGTLRWMRNVMLTFFITGLWHGAAWNYILWGLYHGGLLCLHRIKESLRRRKRRSRHLLMRMGSIVAFFGLTCYGWILFHARTLQEIGAITSILFYDFGNLHLSTTVPTPAALVGLPVFFLAEFIGFIHDGKRLDEVLAVPVWTAVYATMIFALILGVAYVPSQFIYFVF